MNLLEIYIVEFYSVEIITDIADLKDMLKIDAMTNCYGQMKRQTLYLKPEQLEEIREKGFYLG
mgnify:CR=1 FL=1